MEMKSENEILVMKSYYSCGSGGETTTRQKLYEKFQKNWQYPNGWARSFGSSMEEAFEKCVKTWFC